MASPRLQVHVQAGIPHLVAAPVIALAGQHIAETPLFPPDLIPGDLNARLGGFLSEIDDKEKTLIVLCPAPGQNVPAALVVGPAAPLTEAPFAVPEGITTGLFKQASVEGCVKPK